MLPTRDCGPHHARAGAQRHGQEHAHQRHGAGPRRRWARSRLALNTGRHTTTATTTWYWLDDARSAALIDLAGFQEFGLRQVARPSCPP